MHLPPKCTTHDFVNRAPLHFGVQSWVEPVDEAIMSLQVFIQ